MNEFVEEARDFAIKRHGEQLYGNEPYIVHLDHVHEVGLRFGTTIEEQCADYLHDILEDTEMIGPSAIIGRRLNKATILGRRLNDKGKREDYNKEIPITQCLEVRATNRDKSNCLTTVAKDNVLTTMPIGRHPDAFKNNLLFRYYTIKEYCRLQTVPENYFYGVATENQIRKMIGNGWTVDVIAHIFGGLS